MDKADREALRLFYQTLAKGAFTDAQVALYWALLKGREARAEWVRKYGETVGVPREIVNLLNSGITFTKQDIAYIAAAEIAAQAQPVASSLIDRILGYITAPFRWLFGARK